MDLEAIECRLCLKILSENESQVLIDDEIQNSFFDVTQLDLKIYLDQVQNSICEFCFRALQYASFVKNQFIENQKKMREMDDEDTAEAIFTAPIKMEKECDTIEFANADETDDFMDEIAGPSTVKEEKATPKKRIWKPRPKAEKVACDLCHQVFCDIYKLKRHIERLHKPLENESMSFVCNECGKAFSTENNLRSHMMYHRAPSYQCEYCSKQYFDAASLRHHINSNHLEQKQHKCPECDQQYYKTHHLNRHILRAHRNQRFICLADGCGKELTRKDKARAHMKLKHKHIQPAEYDSLMKEVRDDMIDDDE